MRSDLKFSASLVDIDRNQIALAVQQPWADLIVSGRKTVEVRSSPVQLRGAIYIYASKRLSVLADALQIAERLKLDFEALRRGCVLGVVKLTACRLAEERDASAACVDVSTLRGMYAWEVSEPTRFASPVTVETVPYGIWFYPFRPRETLKS